MKVAIVGSRKFPDLAWVKEVVRGLDPSTVVVSGGAKGVDREAAKEARRLGLKVWVFLPKWRTHGKAAGIIRNQQIIHACDKVFAFWDCASQGTADTVRKAVALGIQVTMHTIDNGLRVVKEI